MKSFVVNTEYDGITSRFFASFLRVSPERLWFDKEYFCIGSGLYNSSNAEFRYTSIAYVFVRTKYTIRLFFKKGKTVGNVRASTPWRVFNKLFSVFVKRVFKSKGYISISSLELKSILKEFRNRGVRVKS